MKKGIFNFLLAFASTSLVAQSGYDAVLQQIERNSTRLIALRKQVEAQQLENRTGLYLDNPEIAFNRLWGSPTAIGNRTDFSISQSFDFPTVYAYRGKIANLQNGSAELEYRAERIELLLSAKRICIELTYYNAMIKEHAVRLQNATLIASAYQAKLDMGEINILEYNKAKLNQATAQSEAARIGAERDVLLAELIILNGGIDLEFSNNAFPYSPLPPSFEDWYIPAEAKSPLLQYASRQAEIGRQQVKLNRAMSLPKFSMGYMSEKVVGEQYKGVTVGVSIPLWENKNRVKQARAQIRVAESVLEDTKIQFYNRLRALYTKASTLQKSAQSARDALNSFGNEPLLKKALDAGEISLTEYLLDLEYYYDAINSVLDAEKDFELTLSELRSVEL